MNKFPPKKGRVVSFEASGYKCLILEASNGRLNGYVRVPASHPATQIYYEAIPVDVHGGITFRYAKNRVVWYGFDTNHTDSDAYEDWEVGQVRAETERLARQLRDLAQQETCEVVYQESEA